MASRLFVTAENLSLVPENDDDLAVSEVVEHVPQDHILAVVGHVGPMHGFYRSCPHFANLGTVAFPF